MDLLAALPAAQKPLIGLLGCGVPCVQRPALELLIALLDISDAAPESLRLVLTSSPNPQTKPDPNSHCACAVGAKQLCRPGFGQTGKVSLSSERCLKDMLGGYTARPCMRFVSL